MIKNNDRVGIREVYDLLSDFRKEMKEELLPPLNQLRNSFIALEEGRLTKLEGDHNKLEVAVNSLTATIDGRSDGINKIIVYAGIILSMVVSILGLFLKLKG